MSLRAVVITVSDRSAAGTRDDTAGAIARSEMARAGMSVGEPVIVPDGVESVAGALRRALADGAQLIVTAGGTGVSPRDHTPEGTSEVVTRVIPGIAEELRRRGTAETPHAMLSRGVAGVVDPIEGLTDGALIVNLPGSPRGVASGIPVVLAVAPHVIDQLGGGDHS